MEKTLLNPTRSGKKPGPAESSEKCSARQSLLNENWTEPMLTSSIGE